MLLLYDRTEQDGQVLIRVTAAWYAMRYAFLGLIIAFIFLPDALQDTTVGVLFGAGVFSIIGIRLIGFAAARKEASAMRTGSVEMSGSGWNFRQPLRYTFRAQLAEAKLVSKQN